MNTSDAFTITTIEFCPIDVPLVDPFVVATSQLNVAHNAFVRVTLKDGTIGYGEIAPFPGISEENRETSLVTSAGPRQPSVGPVGAHLSASRA